MFPKNSNIDQDELADISAKIMGLAKKNGATDSEVDISFSTGTSISVRMETLETIELSKDKNITITVYFDKKRGVSSTSDFSSDALKSSVEAACQIAKYTSKDNAFGLADPNLFSNDVKDLKVFHPWKVDQKDMILMALECESNALSYSNKIYNSEGAQLSSSVNSFIYANSKGFFGGFPSSRHSLSCSVLAKDKSGMQRDYSYSSVRSPNDLKSTKTIGIEAAEKALKRLNPKKIKTGRYPVIFEASVATSLISSLVSAISGSNLYRENSFLLNSLEKKVASDSLTVNENPFLLAGNASTYFDDDGVKVMPRSIIESGYLKGYFLSTYSGRRLGMETTGNAGGSHNLIVNSNKKDFDSLLNQMDTGIVITEILGHGLNMVTGDYSRGIAGFWVKKGVIVHPVEEVTVAGNMKDMLLNIVAVSNDTYMNSSRYTGSILIDGMTVASG